MSITVLYFASIKESLNCDKEQINDEVKTVADLIAQLSNRSDTWQSTLQQDSVLIAVNQTISDRNTKLNPGDEVAFFPPVTGG